jgi:hypothetical protein
MTDIDKLKSFLKTGCDCQVTYCDCCYFDGDNCKLYRLSKHARKRRIEALIMRIETTKELNLKQFEKKVLLVLKKLSNNPNCKLKEIIMEAWR